MKNTNNIAISFFFLPGICYLTELIIWCSFPQSYVLNGVLGGLWTLGQIGILVTLSYLYREKIANRRKRAVVGVAIAALGAICYSINYIFGYWLHINTKIFLPAGALLSGIGMIVTGIQVLAAKRWQGANSLLPLLVGLYPFLVMFPLLLITGHPNIMAIMGWGIPWLMLGFGMTVFMRQENKYIKHSNAQPSVISKIENIQQVQE